VQLIVQEYRNTQPSKLSCRIGQRRLKRHRALNQYRLACLSHTRKQVLSSRTQFDVIRQRMRAKLRQYDHGRPARQQDGRACARKKILDSCEEVEINLTEFRLRAGWHGREERDSSRHCGLLV